MIIHQRRKLLIGTSKASRKNIDRMAKFFERMFLSVHRRNYATIKIQIRIRKESNFHILILALEKQKIDLAKSLDILTDRDLF
jgi:hypothetical protein